MERARHGEALRLHPPRLEQRLDGIDVTRGPTDHELLRRVLRTEPHAVAERLERPVHGGTIRDHRQHRPIPGAVTSHRVGTGSRRPRTRRETPGPCGDERGKLAEAVARDDVGLEAEPTQRVPGDEVREKHRPLRVPDAEAEAGGVVPCDLRERGMTRSPRGRIHLGDRRRTGRHRAEVAEHVGVLRSLPRKERRDERARTRCRRRGDGRRGDGTRGRSNGRARHGRPVVDDDVPGLIVLCDGHATGTVGPVANRVDGQSHARRLEAVDPSLWRGEGGRCRQRTGGKRPRQREQACGAGRGAGVADEPVERAGDGGRLTAPVRAADRGQMSVTPVVAPGRGDLDGPHQIGPDVRVPVCRFDRMGHSGRGRAVGTDPDPANDSPNLVAGGTGVGEALEHEHHGTLGRNIPAAHAPVEHARRPVREVPPQRSTLVGHEVEAALAGRTEHRVAVSLPQHVGRGGERRDARTVARIERERPPHEIERLREPARERAAREAAGLVDERRHPLEQLLLVCRDDALPVGRRDATSFERVVEQPHRFRQTQPHLELVREIAPEERAHHDGRAGAVDRLRAAGVGERLVGRLEEHELQRVCRGDLLGRHLVAAPVVREVAHEPADVRHHVPGPRARRIEHARCIPARGRHRTDCGLAAFEPREERLTGQRTGQDAAGTHDRDRVVIRVAGGP